MGADQAEVLVLGIGNVLWADDGFGVRAIEAFHERYAVPLGVALLEGGTQGLNLLDAVCTTPNVLVFDAIDFGLPPGSLKILRDAEVPAWASTKMSLHQASFQEILAIAALRGSTPRRLALVGVQPALLSDFGGSLSAEVRARLPEAIHAAATELSAWGFPCIERTEPPPERLNAEPLALARYESGRPSEEVACRYGDLRFFERSAERC